MDVITHPCRNLRWYILVNETQGINSLYKGFKRSPLVLFLFSLAVPSTLCLPHDRDHLVFNCSCVSHVSMYLYRIVSYCVILRIPLHALKGVLENNYPKMFQKRENSVSFKVILLCKLTKPRDVTCNSFRDYSVSHRNTPTWPQRHKWGTSPCMITHSYCMLNHYFLYS